MAYRPSKFLQKEVYTIAQESEFYVLEIRLLWLLADVYLASQGAYGLNLYAYAAVRALQMGDEARLQRTLAWLERPL